MFCKAQFFIWVSSILKCTPEFLLHVSSKFQCSVAIWRWCCLSFACAQNSVLCLPNWLYFSVNVATLRKRHTIQWNLYFLFFHALSPFGPSSCEGLLIGKGFGCCRYRCFRRLVAESRKKTFTKLIKVSSLLQKGNSKSTDNRLTVVQPEQYLETRTTRVFARRQKKANFEPYKHLGNGSFFLGRGFDPLLKLFKTRFC